MSAMDDMPPKFSVVGLAGAVLVLDSIEAWHKHTFVLTL